MPEIDDLLAQADKLRPLDDDDPKKEPLTAIVDRINEIRAQEAAAAMDPPPDVAPAPQVEAPAPAKSKK